MTLNEVETTHEQSTPLDMSFRLRSTTVTITFECDFVFCFFAIDTLYCLFRLRSTNQQQYYLNL